MSFPESQFVAGKIYEFKHVGYSHYDSCTVFTFKEENEEKPNYWWWHDDEPEEMCSRKFQERT